MRVGAGRENSAGSGAPTRLCSWDCWDEGPPERAAQPEVGFPGSWESSTCAGLGSGLRSEVELPSASKLSEAVGWWEARQRQCTPLRPAVAVLAFGIEDRTTQKINGKGRSTTLKQESQPLKS